MKTSLNRSSSQPRRTTRAAFTKVELLVILVVLSLLLVVRLAAFADVKNQSKLTQCAANLRQLSLAMLLYGSESNDKLPPQGLAGYWLWDLDWWIGDSLNHFGAPKEVMYCPGTAPRFQPANNEDLWEYYAPGSIHVIGYAPTFPGSPSLVATNVNATSIPQPVRLGAVTLPPPLASQRVLVADATLANPAGNYTFIVGGYAKAAHLSPHLNGYLPSGGNLGMLDGHVEWRNFDRMQQRTDASTPGSRPAFYW